ncbi:unnamed protein product [Orchesella dallaii]|uniref:Uncharacterized protein n=1 Tax=Orchesella dallaii TaxID=48710 RepID=A0ABP1RPN1_9HEXA
MRRFIVLMLYLLIANESFLTIQMHVIRTSKRLIDVTDTLNELMQRKSLSVDIFAELGFGETGTEAETKLNLYSPDCSTIQDCVDEINIVGRFWRHTLRRDMLDLRISIPLNNHTFAKLANDNKLNVTLKRPDFQTNYLFNINESMSCDDIPDGRNEVWNSLTNFTEGEYGIGINEVLIECKAAAEQIYAREFAVIYFKFGNTVGIPESFGIFRKRMAYMHAETVRVVQKHAPFLGLEKIWYCPTVEAVGDENHSKLFEDYLYKWKYYGISDMQLIGRTKLLSSTANGFHKTSEFSVVPYMYSGTYSYSVSSVLAFSQHFKKLILDYEGIEDVNSVEPFVVKSILFSIETQESTNYSAKIYTNIGQQITSQGVEVGCVCMLSPELEMKSVATDLVRACNEINGTLYILHHHVIYLRNDSVNPFYYENTMRKVLESAKELRTLILQFQPSAQVYFKLPIVPMNDIVEECIRGGAAFCNEKILSFNELFEAITNWAKLNDFPVILKSAVDGPNHFDHSGWFSYLRPTFWNGSLEYQPKVAELHPLFVLRNYPRNINNWNVDPCIDWMMRQPEIRVDYFYNEYVGAIFDTRYIRQNESIHEILLSYISNRIRFAENILADNLQDFTSACEEFTTGHWRGRKKNYFIGYAFRDAEPVSIQELTQSATFLKFINEVPSAGICYVRGVHIDLSIFDVQTIINDTKIVKTLGEKTKESGINTGILLNSTECMDVFRPIFFSNVSIPQILAPLNYLVCKEG